MKNLRITVNGTSYDVQVEELGADSAVSAPAPAPKTAAPAPAPKQAAPAASSNSGKPVAAPMPGTILSVNVSNGQQIKKGDVLVVLEAMKMENEIKAAQDGTIASVNVSKGETVDSGQTLVTIA